MLAGVYFFNVFAMGYVIYALERSYGTCMEYYDVVWLMAVTLTNLGYGEFTPTFWISRSIVAVLSLFGLFQVSFERFKFWQPVYIKKQDRFFLRTKSRQVSLDRLFSDPYFRQEGRIFLSEIRP